MANLLNQISTNELLRIVYAQHAKDQLMQELAKRLDDALDAAAK